MAGHAQLKFVMTECSMTRIRLTRHKLSVNPTTHITQFFSGEPPFKELEEFCPISSLYLKPNNPQDPIWMEDTHRTAFLQRMTTFRITFSQNTTTHWIAKQPPPTTPSKIKYFAFKDPHICFIWNSVQTTCEKTQFCLWMARWFPLNILRFCPPHFDWLGLKWVN